MPRTIHIHNGRTHVHVHDAWSESEHPRSDNGEFGTKGSNSNTSGGVSRDLSYTKNKISSILLKYGGTEKRSDILKEAPAAIDKIFEKYGKKIKAIYIWGSFATSNPNPGDLDLAVFLDEAELDDTETRTFGKVQIYLSPDDELNGQSEFIAGGDSTDKGYGSVKPIKIWNRS